MLHPYIDIIPFVFATVIILFGSAKLSKKDPITLLVIPTAGIYMIAQSTWFSYWMSGNTWGRDFGNYVWFLFNTLTMVIFSWTLLKSE
jgi:hypothetical protein